MKKTAIILCMLLLVLQTFPIFGGIQEAHAAMAGSGTAADPYIITSPKELSDIRINLSASYKLGADIDLEGYVYPGESASDGLGWMPIGENFTGTLDGNGYTIRNLKIERPSMQYVGLFSEVEGTLSNVQLLEISVHGYRIVGGLSGLLYPAGKIVNSFAASYSAGSSGVKAQGESGGLVGYSNGTISNSYSAGNVTGLAQIGGLVGSNNSGTISNSYSSSAVTGALGNIGGLAGAENFSAKTNSFAVGPVSGAGMVGGLSGLSSMGSVSSSYWDTETSGMSSSPDGTGETTVQMKTQSTFSGWDFTDTWGIRDGWTYPYLLAFKPSLKINALARTTYNLTPGQDQLPVTGTVLDGSVGEQLSIQYDIKDNSNATVKSVTYDVYASGTDQSIDSTIPLTGLPGGSYTLSIKATDTYNPAYVAVPLSFNIDATSPAVRFSVNGNTSPAKTVATTVTVTDAQSGVDATSLHYTWTQTTAVPTSGWSAFSSGDTLTKAVGDGNWYLHVRAADMAGNVADAVSNVFVLDNTAPTATISSTAGGTVNTAFPITVSFSEAVNGFTSGGIVVGNGTLSNLTSVSAAAYTATVTPITSGQPVTVQVVANAAADLAGNSNTASTVASFLYDTTKPTVTFGGFTANQRFITPPSSVNVSVSEAVYWIADGTQLNTSNALPLVSMEKDSVTFSTYMASYNSTTRIFTLTFDGSLSDGTYKVKVAGNAVMNARHNALDAASASFTIAVPVVTGMTANPTNLTSTGGSTNVAIAGSNLTGQTVSIYLDGAAAATANVSSPTSAAATVTLPSNTTASDQTHTLTVYLNGVAIAGQSIAVTVGRAPSSSNSGGGSSPAASVPAIDQNGITLDPGSIDITKPSVTLEVTPKDGAAYVNIPASILLSFAGKNAAFFIEIKTPYGSYQVPVNLASLIPGLADLLTKNNLNAEDISFKIRLSDKSGDKDIQAALANGLPNGKVMGAIVDFHIDIINTKTGQTIGSADKFSKALTRIIPMPKNVTVMPDQWGAFRYNETTKKFEFVPAKMAQIDGVWYAMISSYSNSVYVVAQNAVTFTDVQNHWSKANVELAAAKGLVDGVGESRFDPDRAVTRAEFTAMLLRALGQSASTDSSSPYDDVKPDAWYFGEVAKAKELGLLGYVKGQNFMPNQPLTREEMASMLAAVTKLEKLSTTKEVGSLDGYKDRGSVDAAYLDDVRLMVTLQIMTGTGEGTFSPKGETTRAQAAAVFIRTLEALGMMD